MVSGATDKDEGRHEPTTLTPTSRLCRQQSGLDNLMSTPTWENRMKSKPTYLANFK